MIVYLITEASPISPIVLFLQDCSNIKTIDSYLIMRAGPNLLSTILLVIIMLALDAYVFYALRSLMANAAPKIRTVVFTLFWVLSAIVIASIAFYGKIPWARFMQARAYYLTFAFSFSFSKLMVALFLFIDDGRRAVMWVVEKMRSAPR